MTPRLIALGLTGAALIGGLAWIALRPEPVPVDLHEVRSGPLAGIILADGRTRIRQIYDVSAPLAGTARRSPVEVGDRVVAGETVVAVVEPVAAGLLDARTRAEAEAALREAEAALNVAASQLRQAEEDRDYAARDYERARTLLERGVASLSRLEDAAQVLVLREASVETARAQLAMAEGARDRAAAVLSAPVAEAGEGSCCVEIRAPASGLVLSVEQISERPVPAGARLLSIGDPSDLEIVADLLSSEAVRLPPGARAEVDRWGGPQPLAARLARIAPVARTRVSALGIEEQRVDAVFDLVSPPEERAGLGHGYAVFLRIVEWETGAALTVPLSALFRSGPDWAVFMVEDGRARRQVVRIGRRTATAAEVLDGLSAGAWVITHPPPEVADGVAVAPRPLP